MPSTDPHNIVRHFTSKVSSDGLTREDWIIMIQDYADQISRMDRVRLPNLGGEKCLYLTWDHPRVAHPLGFDATIEDLDETGITLRTHGVFGAFGFGILGNRETEVLRLWGCVKSKWYLVEVTFGKVELEPRYPLEYRPAAKALNLKVSPSSLEEILDLMDPKRPKCFVPGTKGADDIFRTFDATLVTMSKQVRSMKAELDRLEDGTSFSRQIVETYAPFFPRVG